MCVEGLEGVCRRLGRCVFQRFVGCMWVLKAYSVGVKGL